jgi:hypothetical protein
LQSAINAHFRHYQAARAAHCKAHARRRCRHRNLNLNFPFISVTYNFEFQTPPHRPAIVESHESLLSQSNWLCSFQAASSPRKQRKTCQLQKIGFVSPWDRPPGLSILAGFPTPAARLPFRDPATRPELASFRQTPLSAHHPNPNKNLPVTENWLRSVKSQPWDRPPGWPPGLSILVRFGRARPLTA